MQVVQRLVAYHGDESIKTGILAQLAAHRAADELVQGTAWENGKGCAVGCTLHAYDHSLYESRFGIPVELAHLEDSIFEGLSNADAQSWPTRFMSAIRPGADLSRVRWKFLHWLLTDETVNPGIGHGLVKDAVSAVARLCERAALGEAPSDDDWSAAESAAWSAAWSAESAESAAWSAESAARSAARSARSAGSAARSAESAARSAESAESAAWSAESAAWSAESAAWSAAWKRMADKLIELLEAA